MAYMIVDADKLDAKLSDLADKIRSKNRTTEGLDFFKGDFSEAVDNITGYKEEQEKTLTVTENGTYEVVPDAEKALSKVVVDVAVPLRYDEGYGAGYSEGYEASQDSITLQEKTVTENGEVTADEGYTGLSTVNVNVPERKEEQTKALEVTENGSYDIFPDEGKVLSSASVNVNVQDKELAEIETLIDESGVLDSTEGTATEKVEELVEKSEERNLWYEWQENYSVANVMSQIFNRYKGTQLPKCNFSKCPNTSRFLYEAANLTSIDFYINCESSTSGDAMFYGTTALKRIKGFNSSKMTTMNQCFLRSGIEEIEQAFDFSNMTNPYQAFACNNLKEIRFVTETIKVSIAFSSAGLTAKSIQSIIDGLATVETQQTLTFNSTVVANLTDEQLITIVNKNWTVG